MTKKMHKGCPLPFLHLLSFLVSVAPLGAAFAFNFDEYVTTVADTVKLGLGSVILVVLFAMKALGKLKVPRRVVFFAFTFLGAYLFAAVLEDLLLLSGAALLGEVLDLLFLQPMIKRSKSERERGKVADATAERVEELLDKYIGGRI